MSTFAQTPRDQHVPGRGPAVGRAALARVVDLARRAPSIHNSQPWAWHAAASRLDLRADRARSVPRADPDGRSLTISCGTALHHARLAAAALGLETSVVHLPDAGDEDLLARVSVRGGHERPADAEEVLAAIDDRCTDRRRFTTWPVPPQMLVGLADAAAPWGAAAAVVKDPATRLRIEALTGAARVIGSRDAGTGDETRSWIDRGEHDGIPSGALPTYAGARGEYRHRFEPAAVPDAGDTRVAASDDLLVLSTGTDTPIDWLRAGEALSALWLEATRLGLSVVPLTEVLECPALRSTLGSHLDLRHPHPQLLLRIGWQHIGRSALERTPRRPLNDVLRGRS